MRIGIIATARSGGYNLGQWMNLELGIPFYHEPHTFKTEITSDKWIQKWLVGEWWDMVWKGIRPEADKLIRLWREDSTEAAISTIRARERGEWHTEYTLTEDWLNQKQNEILTETKRADGDREWLKSIPVNGLDITYEGIYENGGDIQKLIDYLGIDEPKYLQLLDNSLRLRGDKRNKKKRLI